MYGIPSRRSAGSWAGKWAMVLLAVAPPLLAMPPEDLEVELVVDGLSRPLIVRHAGDGTNRLFIAEQRGLIRIFDGSNGTATRPTPFLDLSLLVSQSGNERGLLGLDFHPDFASNGLFYVSYTDPAGDSVLARYQVSDADPQVADPLSAQILFFLSQPYSNHNGGNILFGPDGYLYYGLGDGGLGGDPDNQGQTPSTLLGNLLRLDVEGDDFPLDALQNYAIPPDNPFVGTAGMRDEIWAWGLRNPWRFSFDRLTGDLFLGDVGQGDVEEIDLLPAGQGGLNLGWRCREGNRPFNDIPPCPGPLTEPILIFLHGDARASVTGGYRYRGAIAGLQGTYIYGDFESGRIWLANDDPASPTGWSSTLWRDTSFFISTFGEDEAGELYFADLFGGTVYRFVQEPIFRDGFESGDTDRWSHVP